MDLNPRNGIIYFSQFSLFIKVECEKILKLIKIECLIFWNILTFLFTEDEIVSSNRVFLMKTCAINAIINNKTTTIINKCAFFLVNNKVIKILKFKSVASAVVRFLLVGGGGKLGAMLNLSIKLQQNIHRKNFLL